MQFSFKTCLKLVTFKILDSDLEVLRQKLFDEQTPVAYLFDLISQCQNEVTKKLDSCVELQPEDERLSVKLRQKFQMKKCVDFSAEFQNG
jgi:hypothetical protein